eukprot:g1068.t1
MSLVVDDSMRVYGKEELEKTISMINETAIVQNSRTDRTRKRSSSDPSITMSRKEELNNEWWDILTEIEEVDSPLPLHCYEPERQHSFIPLRNVDSGDASDQGLSESRKRKKSSDMDAFGEGNQCMINHGAMNSVTNKYGFHGNTLNIPDEILGEDLKELPIGPSASLKMRDFTGKPSAIPPRITSVPIVQTDPSSPGFVQNKWYGNHIMPSIHRPTHRYHIPQMRRPEESSVKPASAEASRSAGKSKREPYAALVSMGGKSKSSKSTKSSAASSRSKRTKRAGRKRGGYTCAKCGAPKKGHLCPFRRQWAESGTQIDFSLSAPHVIVARSTSTTPSVISKGVGSSSPCVSPKKDNGGAVAVAGCSSEIGNEGTDKEFVRQSISVMRLA